MKNFLITKPPPPPKKWSTSGFLTESGNRSGFVIFYGLFYIVQHLLWMTNPWLQMFCSELVETQASSLESTKVAQIMNRKEAMDSD